MHAPEIACMLYKKNPWKVTKNYEVYEVLKWHHLPSNRLSLRDSARRLWGQWWWGWLRLWRTWLLFRLLVQSFYNAGCLCHGRWWCWSKHIYGRKSDSEMELIFYLPSCFSGLYLHVLLLQDLSPSIQDKCFTTCSQQVKQKAVILPLEEGPLWEEVYILFHLVEVRELIWTSIHKSIKVQTKKILTKDSHSWK